MKDLDREYVEGLTRCETLMALCDHVTQYRDLAKDAYRVVVAMSPVDFIEFRLGLKLERRGRFAGEAWAARFAAVLMPLPMMTITRIAEEYKVPFDVAVRRVKELKPELLEVEEGSQP